ncbi:18981_t:CDS:1, partial [Gigaspora margarita]
EPEVRLNRNIKYCERGSLCIDQTRGLCMLEYKIDSSSLTADLD